MTNETARKEKGIKPLDDSQGNEQTPYAVHFLDRDAVISGYLICC